MLFEAGLFTDAALDVSVRSVLDDAILYACAVDVTDIAMIAFAGGAGGKGRLRFRRRQRLPCTHCLSNFCLLYLDLRLIPLATGLVTALAAAVRKISHALLHAFWLNSLADTGRVRASLKASLATRADGLSDELSIRAGDDFLSTADVALFGPSTIIFVIGADVHTVGLAGATFLGDGMINIKIRADTASASEGGEEARLPLALAKASYVGCLASVASSVTFATATVGVVAEAAGAVNAH